MLTCRPAGPSPRFAASATRCLTFLFGVLGLDSKFIVRVASIGVLTTLVVGVQAGAQERLVKITTKKDGKTTDFYVQNLQSADVTVTLEMDLKNYSSNQKLPYTTTVPPKTAIKAFSLTPTEADKDSSWSYTYYATWGSLTATHDDSAVYILPYAVGDSFPVSQGYGGTYSHTGGDKYSIDWRMPVGTPIHAARAGTVVGVKADSSEGGGDKKYEWDANYILIKHNDGTLGHYVHLKKDGVTVKLGQEVEAGQLIGFSGNTGHSTGPHLHFAVFKAHDGKQRQTIPIRYFINDSSPVVLAEGRSYKAVGAPASRGVKPAASTGGQQGNGTPAAELRVH